MINRVKWETGAKDPREAGGTQKNRHNGRGGACPWVVLAGKEGPKKTKGYKEGRGKKIISKDNTQAPHEWRDSHM